MEEQKDLGSYSEGGAVSAVSVPSTDSHPYAFLNGNYRNAEAWTNEFMRLHGDKIPDWGNMIGWFANAIETQHFDDPPELLAALQAVEEWWLTDGMKNASGAPYAIFAARAAIAKALGQ